MSSSYNLANPPSLLYPGLLEGAAIALDQSSLSPLSTTSNSRIYTGKTLNPTLSLRGGLAGWVAIKAVDCGIVRVPRNLDREADLLHRMNHQNIVALLNAYLLPSPSLTPTFDYVLFMPYYRLPLSALLNSPSFVPPKIASSTQSDFSVLAHTLIWQMMDAVRYLHANGIAHRDISVGNFVLSDEGRIVLIDFGISVEEGNEAPGEMSCEIGTGPYRAPELLFSSRAYDPHRLDLWSLGAVIAEFFTPFTTRASQISPSSSLPDSEIRATSSYGDTNGAVDMEEHAEGDLEEMETKLAAVFLATEDEDQSNEVKRAPLFYSGFGELLLIGSIFRIVGTPDYTTWPEARFLPHFSQLAFAPFPPTPLSAHLPYLRSDSPLAVILPMLLVCRPTDRISLENAMFTLNAGWEGLEYYRLDWEDEGSGVREKTRLKALLAGFL